MRTSPRSTVTRKIAVLVCLVFTGFIVAFASTSPRKLLEARSSDHGWEADISALDQLSIALQSEPDSIGYVIVYGGRKGSRNDIAKRMSCMKTYLIKQRGTAAARLKVINGGYREDVMIELWVRPDGSPAPAPRPTLKTKDVRFKRSGTLYRCDL
jgi:hypothetical protein